MILTGYCQQCHRIRPVRIAGTGMVRLAAGGIPTGVCGACKDKEEAERRGGSR